MIGALKETYWILWPATLLSSGFFILGFYKGTDPSTALHVLFGLMFAPSSAYLGYAKFIKSKARNDMELIVNESPLTLEIT